MKKHGTIRAIYLYGFALLGLVLITIGSVGFINMGLKAYVFTQADEETRIEHLRPPSPYALERVEEIRGSMTLTANEKAQVQNWLADYENWKMKNEQLDPVIADRHRDASINLAMILVGLPLYLYHWGVIRRESGKKHNKT